MPYPQRAAHEDGGHEAELQQVHARHFASVVAGGYVGDFMRHHAGHFGFFVGARIRPEFT